MFKVDNEVVEMSIRVIKNYRKTVSNTPHLDMGCGIAIEALEKQIPKKPDYEGDGYDEHGNLIYDTAYCPNCRHMFEVDYDATDYCPNCGQALDWRTVE